MSDAALLRELPGGGRVLFSERRHGNLSSTGGEHAEHGHAARERLREAIGVSVLARGRQVHGTHVRWIAEPPTVGEQTTAAGAEEEADGQATALNGVGALVLSADCLPIALGTEGAVAMLHAGWRGLAAGVLEQGIASLRAHCHEGQITAVVGPGAGPCCYEVGPEVQRALGRRPGAGARVDLRAIARERLLAAGVLRVSDVEACTICDERFFSHRREGARAGRQGGVAWLS